MALGAGHPGADHHGRAAEGPSAEGDYSDYLAAERIRPAAEAVADSGFVRGSPHAAAAFGQGSLRPSAGFGWSIPPSLVPDWSNLPAAADWRSLSAADLNIPLLADSSSYLSADLSSHLLPGSSFAAD